MKSFYYMPMTLLSQSLIKVCLKTKVSHGLIFIAIFKTLHSMRGKKNLNIETEKSEQKLFAQISLFQF